MTTVMWVLVAEINPKTAKAGLHNDDVVRVVSPCWAVELRCTIHIRLDVCDSFRAGHRLRALRRNRGVNPADLP